jgi:transposase
LYREEKERVKRSHYQIVWLLRKGCTSAEVKEVSGYSLPWIRAIAKRYNQEGPSGLGDKRLKAPGGHCILNETQQQELYEALLSPHPQEGLWNSRLVAEWIYQKTGRKVHAQRGWEYLKRLGFSLKRPRPRQRQADATEQADFKKSSSWSPS